MKYRNLWRNTAFTVYFNAIVTTAFVAIWKLFQGGPLFGWLGMLLTTGPLVVYVSYALISLRVARTSQRLPVVGIQAVLGVVLTAYGAFVTSEGWLLFLVAVVFLVGFIWYAYSFAGFLGVRPSDRLRKNQVLPAFSLRDATGQSVTSSQLFERPMVLIFYRGNWCPFCMAQVKEMSQRYQEIEFLGAGVAFISSQPQAKTAALAARFDIPALFLVDDGNNVARSLGIASEFGVPTGVQLLGYDSHTVMPTVVITEVGGRILWADETDNYRVRPEPATYVELLRSLPGRPA